MSTKSIVCACAVCSGTQCRCGCQNSATRATTCAGCGQVCKCTETCSCKAS